MEFGQFYADHKDSIKNYILSLTKGNTLFAEEVEIAVWDKAMNKFNSYEDNGKGYAWLSRIAFNSFIDTYRKRIKGRSGESVYTSSYDANPDFPFDQLLPASVMPENFEEEISVGKRITKLIAENLPSSQRRVIIFRSVNRKRSFKEIAEIEGLSINTVIGNMRYARINILKNISDYLSPEEMSAVVYGSPKIKSMIEKRGPNFKKQIFKT